MCETADSVRLFGVFQQVQDLFGKFRSICHLNSTTGFIQQVFSILKVFHGRAKENRFSPNSRFKNILAAERYQTPPAKCDGGKTVNGQQFTDGVKHNYFSGSTMTGLVQSTSKLAVKPLCDGERFYLVSAFDVTRGDNEQSIWKRSADFIKGFQNDLRFVPAYAARYKHRFLSSQIKKGCQFILLAFINPQE